HDAVVAEGGIRDIPPAGLARGPSHREPGVTGAEPPLQHELRLTLLGRDGPDHILVEAGRQRLGLDIRHEAVRVRAVGDLIDDGPGLVAHLSPSLIWGGAACHPPRTLRLYL